ncbi:MAG: DUF5655 domain-containing protein [Parcubacteria group bacterium]|jgi:predicted transport protein
MPIFKIEKNKLAPINEKKIDLEKDIQKITEENLETVFSLKFVSSEFALHGFRIDTLAFDNEAKSFVIIEFKRDRSFSVVDQGFAYLALMVNNKSDFILEFNEKTSKNLKREDVDWSQSRVMFVANSFTNYQQNAINFKDLPIELWETKVFDNDTIYFNQIISSNSQESINKLVKNKEIEKVSREIKKYAIDDHFKKDWIHTRELFEEIREKILALDGRIEESVKKYYIGYKIGFYNICSIHSYKSKLILHLVRVEKNDLKDPENKIEIIPWEQRGWGKLCGYTISKSEDIDYALFLIKQVYEKFYK